MIVLLAIALGVVATILQGFVLKVLWGWFFVPLGAPAITIPLALGVALTVGMLTHQSTKGDDEDWPEKLAGAFAGPLIVLLFGWVIRGFM